MNRSAQKWMESVAVLADLPGAIQAYDAMFEDQSSDDEDLVAPWRQRMSAVFVLNLGRFKTFGNHQ